MGSAAKAKTDVLHQNGNLKGKHTGCSVVQMSVFQFSTLPSMIYHVDRVAL